MTEVEPMPGPARVVLVGGGLAAAKTAQSLRKRGYEGELTLLTAESHRPYERPGLSKGYLTGATSREALFVHDADWYRQQGVDLHTGTRVVALDRERREVRTAGGDRFGYDTVLLATGAVPRRLDILGGDLDGVLYLRTLDDSETLRDRLTAGRRVVIVGGGWIGLETAAAARGAGCSVTVVETAPQPLLRVLGPELALAFADLHREHGVRFRLGVSVEAFVADGAGRVAGLRLADGEVLPADTVVVGIGVTPADGLAREAGLEVSDGVVVGADLRTADPTVVAAGDVAAAYHPLLGRRLRFEHWANALRQAPVAAAALLGEPKSYERLPYVFSDQYDVSLEYVGAPRDPGNARVVVRGSVPDRAYLAFWLDGGRVEAAMTVGVPDVVPALEGLVRSAGPVDEQRLADPAVPLEDVAAGTPAGAGQREGAHA
jgi:3-phenylpropionate/trans-cinnamate dioxygenase ferredoxin reductase subunit